MAKIERFEEILGWQSGRELCNLVYDLTKKGLFSRDFGLRDQMRRAVVSVISNIAEGFNRSKAKYLNCLDIAIGESNEAENWLYKLRDSKLLENDVANNHVAETIQTQKMLTALHRSISRRPA